MAVRGSEAKDIVSKVILNVFKNAFINDKEIRVPVMWDGEEIQIKVTLTAAKTNVEHEGGTAIKPEIPANAADVVPIGPLSDEEKNKIIEQLRGLIELNLDPIKSEVADMPF